MVDLSREFIRDHLADSAVIFQRGVHLFEHGSFVLKQADMDKGWFAYEMDGNFGDYAIRIQLANDKLVTSCDCPYPGNGCKHTVAALLDTLDVVQRWRQKSGSITTPPVEEPYLAPEEIRQQAIEDRKRRARSEAFTVTQGEMLKGEHLLETTSGRQYVVTLHDPASGQGHCNCPDFLTNRIGTCKHLIFLVNYLKKKRGFKKQVARERFPFVDIYWDSVNNQPRVFAERPLTKIKSPDDLLSKCFSPDGLFAGKELSDLLPLLNRLNGNKRIRVQETLLDRLDGFLQEKQMAELAHRVIPPAIKLKTRLYPYQESGIKFGLFKKAALIGDEMGLGKTLQAIALSILKMVIFSEWTTMTFLIARHLSDAGIPFVELSGKMPVKKRQALIDEFTHNPDCKVFLSTDAGGTGLNLQAADCVVNFEFPWNPAKLNQRIGRVNRIGQKSRCVNVVNLISKNSIEEKILAGIQLKTDLFSGVF